MENPLDRAARDVDGLRRFLAADDRDFAVKVFPTVTSSGPLVQRTDTCAVVALHDVPIAAPTCCRITPIIGGQDCGPNPGWPGGLLDPGVTPGAGGPGPHAQVGRGVGAGRRVASNRCRGMPAKSEVRVR